MESFFSSDFTLGILGGGQLGKMLLYETRKFDVRTLVLDKSKEAPGKYGANVFIQGDLMDYDTVLEFGRKVNLLTIEIEAVNVRALQQLEKEGITVYPSSQTLLNIQDKGVQKKFYAEKNLPTAAFTVYRNGKEAKAAVLNGESQLPLVWKSCTGGYDGKGVRILKEESQLDTLPDTECLLEEKVAYTHELAVIVCRSAKGEVVVYPVVEMEFHPEANQVEYVLCPARIPEGVAEKAKQIARNVSEAFGHVGLLAIELFLTKDGDILINEIAPRPHNSGHFSIEASYTNQFEQHLRAILGLPLGSTETKANSVMVNVVGEEGYTGEVIYQNIAQILELPGVTPHIYGKKETRPFRKMGHVTIINEDMNKARKIAEVVKQTLRVHSKTR